MVELFSTVYGDKMHISERSPQKKKNNRVYDLCKWSFFPIAFDIYFTCHVHDTDSELYPGYVSAAEYKKYRDRRLPREVKG